MKDKSKNDFLALESWMAAENPESKRIQYFLKINLNLCSFVGIVYIILLASTCKSSCFIYILHLKVIKESIFYFPSRPRNLKIVWLLFLQLFLPNVQQSSSRCSMLISPTSQGGLTRFYFHIYICPWKQVFFTPFFSMSISK